jgi:AcrR family transcriptional regulator
VTRVDKPPQPPRKRRRDPDGHRAEILAAAQAAFAERGYSRATIRDIAQRAGVTHGLVLQQFTSKEQLFLAAVPGHRDLERLIAGDVATLPDRIAAGFIERLEADAASDPLVALVRSAASDEATATRLYAAMQENSAALYRAVLSGDDADVRVALLGAHLIGVTFNRYIARSGPLAAMPPDEVITHLARTLRAILFG